MGSIIGIGGWTPYYFYLLLTTATKLVKDDIFLGNGGLLSFDLVITNHTIMCLLVGYLSEAFFGFLLYMFFKYREYKRKKKKNMILFEKGLEYQQKSTLDMILEMKNKLDINYDKGKGDKSNNNNTKNLLDNGDSSNINSINNSNNTYKNIHSLRKVSLIHNDLYEDITYNSFWYIILSCFLIDSKEFLNKILYSTYDTFDYFFLNLVIITLILKYFYKQRIYKHHMLSVIIVIIFSGTCLISCLFINNIIDDKQSDMKNIINNYQGDIYKIFILIFLYIIISISFCSGIVLQKNLMENKFVSPYKMIFYKGIVGIIQTIIGLIISSNLKCGKTEKVAEMSYEKIFDFFVCLSHYEGNSYYDHFLSYFSSVENTSKETIIIILYFIFHFFTEFSLILINKFLSPTHYLIAESLYSLIHVPLNYLTTASYDEILSSLEKGDKKFNIGNFYNAVVHTFGVKILKFIACFFDFLGYIIYLEIIELKFCGLNKNIKRNIEKRAIIDVKMDEDDSSSCDSEESEETLNNPETKEKEVSSDNENSNER